MGVVVKIASDAKPVSDLGNAHFNVPVFVSRANRRPPWRDPVLVTKYAVSPDTTAAAVLAFWKPPVCRHSKASGGSTFSPDTPVCCASPRNCGQSAEAATPRTAERATAATAPPRSECMRREVFPIPLFLCADTGTRAEAGLWNPMADCLTIIRLPLSPRQGPDRTAIAWY